MPVGSIMDITWDEFLEDLSELCERIQGVERIVGMPRRGYIPATLMALRLNLPMEDVDSPSTLVVDDDSYRGNGIRKMREKYPKSKICVCYLDVNLVNEVDYYCRLIDFTELDEKRIRLRYPWEKWLAPTDELTRLTDEDDWLEKIDRRLYESPPKPRTRRLRVMVDLDGVICATRKGMIGSIVEMANAPPILENIEKLRILKDKGYEIIIYTSRASRAFDSKVPSEEDTTIGWLKKWNVPYDGIVFDKPWADYYIDDRNTNLEELCER